MSEQAPEPRGRGRENVFTRRIGPLPMWQWFAIALAMILVYVLYQYRKTSQANANAANTAGGTSTGGTTGAGQVPQFVNQTYTYVAPPSAQQPPPSSHGSNPPPQPAPAPAPQPSSNIVGETLSSATGGSGPPNVVGMSLSQAIKAIQGAGWSITSVVSAKNPYQLASTTQNANAKVISSVPHAFGLSGQYNAKSVSLAIP